MIPTTLLALASLYNGQIWHFFPLVIAVSLVYGATRHEQMPIILDHALRFGVWITCFMAVIFTVLLGLSWWL